MGEPHYIKAAREAAERVAAVLALPDIPEDECYNEGEAFDPWSLFPCLYGSYSSEFDQMALAVLRSLDLAARDQWDAAIAMQRKETLAHEMFREMLCTAGLCTYGTSPRVCFAEGPFRPLLPALIAKWEAYYAVRWGEPAPNHTPSQ